MNASATLPFLPSVSIEPGAGTGFKEWALICRSMLRGQTSVIFRKGGIAEGRQGFRFKHREFFLFPTFFHEQVQSVRLAESAALEEPPASVTIQAWAKVEFTVWVDDLARLEPLRELHVLADHVLRQRFDYSEPRGLHLAFLRVYALSEPWVFPYRKSFGGCRSWVELPSVPSAMQATALLADEEQARRRARVQEAFPG